VLSSQGLVAGHAPLANRPLPSAAL